MHSILSLFMGVASFLAVGTLFLPVAGSLFARQRKIVFEADLKLFEIYIFSTLIVQLSVLILALGFGIHNLFIFRIYLPLHTAFFTYFLLNWVWGKNRIIILLVILTMVISFLGDYLLGDSEIYPYFMVWFDAILLFGLSFLLSFLNDKRKVYLEKEFELIHIGIYLYSIITFIGLFPSQIGYENYSLFLQSFAIVISNYYFARSFTCLIHSRG